MCSMGVMMVVSARTHRAQSRVYRASEGWNQVGVVRVSELVHTRRQIRVAFRACVRVLEDADLGDHNLTLILNFFVAAWESDRLFR